MEKNEILEESTLDSEEAEFTAEETLEEASPSEETDFSTEDSNTEEEFAKKDPEEEEEDSKAESDSEAELEEEEEEKKPASNHSLEEYEALTAEVESLRAEVAELREFKLTVENQEKDELINQYFMLSDEDKKEIIEHKSEYTLDEIKSKLAVLYVEKNVDFSSLTGEASEPVAEPEEEPITSFSLDTPVTGFAPSFLSALRETAKN